MAKGQLPRIDGTETIQQLKPQESVAVEHVEKHGGYATEIRAWSRIEVKQIPIAMRKALCKKMYEAQISGACLANGKQVKDKRGLLLLILENALSIR